MQLTEDELDKMITLVEELCGVYLDQSKGYLIESRLESVAQKHGCQDYAQLISRALDRSQASLRDEIVDAITTNETLFFRDTSPFDALRFKILPELLDVVESGRRSKRLRIWSAACSTGQEAYSMAMTLCDVIPDIGVWDISILGTDISRAAVEKAQLGYYSELELSRGVDQAVKSQYFQAKGTGWEVKPELRQLVRFEVRNLLAPLEEKNCFDIVLCRNVAIYFKKEERTDLFHRIVDTMTTGGILFVGSSENLSDIGPQFVPESHCNCTLYRPKLQSHLCNV